MSGKKVIMLGNEAIARGAYEAGVKVSAAYPGTPSTEISESLVKYKDDVSLKICFCFIDILVSDVSTYKRSTFPSPLIIISYKSL